MRRAVLAFCAAAGWWLLSCREIPAPEDGVLSISALMLPSPGLVVGDTMRDSVGIAAPLRVVAYDVRGDPVPGAQPTFIALDTGAHLVGAFLVGDDTVATRVVGKVAGLQTEPITVKVTLAPQVLTAVDSTRHVVTFVEFADTVANSTDLRTRVTNLQGTTPKGIEAVIVHYAVVESPAPRDNDAGPTIVLIPGGTPVTRDTTDGSGIAGRTARFRFAAITAPRTDSTVIAATASYRGQTLGTVQFTVVFVKQ